MKLKALQPDVIITIGMDEIPLPSTYGAAEMKFYIRRNTYRAAIIMLALFLGFLLGNYIMRTVERNISTEIKVAPITRASLEDLPPPGAETADIPPPPDVIINTGPAARAGNPIPVPDAMIAPDLQDFATIDVIDRAGAEGGTGEDLGGFAGNIDWEGTREVRTDALRDRMPEPDEFVPNEKDPYFDMERLQRMVVYPEMARRAGVEGMVFVRALVDRTGKITRTIIDHSDNRMLDQAALKAVQDYGYATPAVMNDEPIHCWVTVRIVFKLR